MKKSTPECYFSFLEINWVDSAHYQPDWIVNWWTFAVSEMEVRNVAEQFPGLQNEQI